MSEMTPTAEAPLRITTRISLKLKRRPGRETIVEDLELTGGNIQGDTVNSGINVPLNRPAFRGGQLV